MMRYQLQSETLTLKLGAIIANALPPPALIYLQGQLGAGKTTLVRGLLQALGYNGIVKSPTYTLVEPYIVADHIIYHFDLYRLAEPEELENIGLRDYLQQNALCLIEWPEKAAGYLPAADLILELNYHPDIPTARYVGISTTNTQLLQQIALLCARKCDI